MNKAIFWDLQGTLGGDLCEREKSFFAAVESRPDDYVTGWLENAVNCPVFHIDGALPVEENVEYLVSILGN